LTAAEWSEFEKGLVNIDPQLKSRYVQAKEENSRLELMEK